jgi:hypothetical protein
LYPLNHLLLAGFPEGRAASLAIFVGWWGLGQMTAQEVSHQPAASFTHPELRCGPAVFDTLPLHAWKDSASAAHPSAQPLRSTDFTK